MKNSFREQISYSLLFKSTAFDILLVDSAHYAIGLACKHMEPAFQAKDRAVF